MDSSHSHLLLLAPLETILAEQGESAMAGPHPSATLLSALRLSFRSPSFLGLPPLTARVKGVEKNGSERREDVHGYLHSRVAYPSVLRKKNGNVMGSK